MKYTLGFSPCPNDTFIFDALVNHKIDTEGLEFDVVLADVQKLNHLALDGQLDFTKISYGVLPLVLNDYVLLNSGGALGIGVGPLLISKTAHLDLSVNNFSVAIPGENTTAHMLFSLAFPEARNKVFKVFNEIEDAVLNDEVDCGVIIHENRFTYQDKGLEKLADLGEYWETQTQNPIPLGGIVANRNLKRSVCLKVDSLIKRSIEYAYTNDHKDLSDYVKKHSQEMSEDVMRKHIDLYVNNYSLSLGEEGKSAVLKLFEVYQQLHADTIISPEDIFL